MPEKKLDDRVAVVTGGGSGIGRAICERFAEAGARTVILDRDADAAAGTERHIADRGDRAVSLPCDVADHGQVHAAMERVLADHGRIDVLVNNAGIAHIGNLAATSEADMDRLFAVNVKGVYNCMHAAIGPMAGRGGGVILNLASIAANLGIAERFAYSMTKGAVQAMTYSVARDYIDKGVRCNCICPARVHTPFVDNYLHRHYAGREQEVFEQLSRYQPIGRMAEPREIAALALFLCCDEAGFITGCSYDIDGGVMRLR